MEFSFEDIESTAKAIGNASKAMVSIGPTEDGPSSKVTTTDALNVIEAAKLANVNHIVVFTNLMEGLQMFLMESLHFSATCLENQEYHYQSLLKELWKWD